MPTMRWDPDRYLRHADERARPFLDLLARVSPAAPPRTVVDLGCGPGTLTTLLADRWPEADVTGLDSSAEMVASARGLAPARVRFAHADLRTWVRDVAPGSVDVLLTNATLQWVPGHLDLLPGLVRSLAPGGWLALQVPGNHDEPSHTLRRDLAAREPYAAFTADVAAPHAHDPADYLAALADADPDLVVDAWETTYLHVLTGPDPIFSWVTGTGARPTLQALPDDVRPAFEEEFRALLRAAYPATPGLGTVLPFRRVFAVAHRPPAEPTDREVHA